MKFSPQQVKRFRDEGWLGVPEFWTDREISAMRVELQGLRDAGLLHNVSTECDGTTCSKRKANLQLCPMYPHSRFFRAMPFADKVAQAIGQLIGDPVILHLDQVFLKPAVHGAGTNWHQDIACFRIPDPLGGTAMWTAMHDATVANKTDSDRAGIAHHFVNGSMKDIRWRKKKLSENPWLSGPAASGGEREYGERISGTWEREVERLH
ncbi:MAG: phytanoyl-CoA dioxygenase family protein [Anaerolineaceae bacterium]|nr:phytanoyl-CoA dioxygenase family protein [Anaerolineaceae bacterium]MDE0330020.1 phytanoyl-CoA dioxygenase family protein [Anaerolineaceae bacterium]